VSFAEAGCARRLAVTLVAAMALGACGVADDLLPSGKDQRPPVTPGSEGPSVGQSAPDFARPDVFAADHALYQALQSAPGVILYFNMWCPICDAHMFDLQHQVLPAFPDVPIWVTDYVSGSVSNSRTAQLQLGWDGAPFTFLVDVGAGLEAFYQAPMALVVIGSDHLVKYNGEYDWTRLQPVLAALPRTPAGSGSAP
jgi:peroxiredoxin